MKYIKIFQKNLSQRRQTIGLLLNKIKHLEDSSFNNSTNTEYAYIEQILGLETRVVNKIVNVSGLMETLTDNIEC